MFISIWPPSVPLTVSNVPFQPPDQGRFIVVIADTVHAAVTRFRVETSVPCRGPSEA